MHIPHRALGIVREIAGEMGHDITYAYDDLVFMDHNAYLLQFTKDNDTLNLYFNIEFPGDEADTMAARILDAASKRDMKIVRKGHYELAEKPDDNLEVRFFNATEA
ncbi:hypothetical protein [Prosthecochloris sp. HL-130-GSB]|jgi:hypothetical protein|uniref:Uncharacterized protein n=1 Tax=Prosthecochloris aestuarii TaxID=1102 RepID=A0A831SUP6_PROAE|nr:hypothetical protein [Prosthecochloris sp. HL-130-GSB]ARM31131.1 hypothetical protein B9H02_07285 [Prosthecochloris sp. HL-130-GSB]MBO8093597.1 hypothetical protein [Prosthecochloris sp.]HED31228.1 hypothetical protein [Prosthecochloris aestuarii]